MPETQSPLGSRVYSFKSMSWVVSPYIIERGVLSKRGPW